MSNFRLINAEKLFEEVGQAKPRNKEHYKAIGEFMNMITNSETINTRPKGEWIVDSTELKLICSECKATFSFVDIDELLDCKEYAKYCIECGADMRGDKE